MIRPDGSLRISGEAFAIERLRENPDLDYAVLQLAANEAGVAIQPIQFGRARRQLGLTGTTTVDAAPARPAQRNAEAASTVAVPTAVSADGAPTDAAPPPAPAAAPSAPTAEPTTPGAVKPAGAKPTAAGKSSPAFEFLMQALRDDPTVSYGELKAKADRDGFRIAPIMYGRAKALLGLVPVRPRGSGKRGKAARKAEVASAPAPRSLQQVESTTRSKPAAAARGTGGDAGQGHRIEDLVALVQRLEDERRRLRGVLIQIANSIDAALDHDA